MHQLNAWAETQSWCVEDAGPRS